MIRYIDEDVELSLMNISMITQLNRVAKDTKIFLKMKNKGYLSIEKNIIKYGKIKPLHK